MAEDWKRVEGDNDKRREMLKCQRLVRLVVKISVTASVSAALFYIVSRIYSVVFSPPEERNNTKLLLLSCEFFFNTQNSPVYEIVWFSQTALCCFFDLAMTNCDGLFITLVLHLCTQLKILRTDVKNLSPSPKRLNFVRTLRSLVERHTQLNRYKFL